MHYLRKQEHGRRNKTKKLEGTQNTLPNLAQTPQITITGNTSVLPMLLLFEFFDLES